MTIPFRSKGWAILLGLTLLLALALVAVACGDEEEEGEVKDIQRSPETPIVIPADVPVMIGVSVPLTGPDKIGGNEDLNGVVVGVDAINAQPVLDGLLRHPDGVAQGRERKVRVPLA